jgi:hypothetical protein
MGNVTPDVPVVAAVSDEPKTSPPTVKSSVTAENHLLQHANLYATLLFVVTGILWLCCMPRRSSSDYDLPAETDLCSRIQQAQVAAGQPVLLPAGCPALPAPKGSAPGAAASARPAVSPVSWTLLRQVDATTSTGGDLSHVEDLKADLTVWNRYEYESKTFEWGKDINWYLYSSLRVLVIVLSALTPALIVAPILNQKKFIAALPAAIVAIATGCISEFDFKEQAAAYTQAAVDIQGEKTAFITRSKPLYDYVDPLKASQLASLGASPPGTSTQGSAGSQGAPKADGVAERATCGNGDVPFPSPTKYDDIRANFGCRIQDIWETQSLARLLFLRGQQQPSQVGGTQTGAGRVATRDTHGTKPSGKAASKPAP